MPRPISLAHLTVLDTTPPELITVADAAGFRTVGIRLTATPSVGVPPYDVLHEGPMLRETERRLKDTGVSVLDTEFLRFEPERPIGVPEGFLEVSARLGAKHVLVMSAEPEEARTLERFGELCDRAAPYGLTVGLEFAVYTGVRTLAHAAQMVARSKRTNTSIVVDALGLLLGWNIIHDQKQTPSWAGLEMVVPWADLVLIFVAVYAVALLATLAPAIRASGRPACASASP